MGSVTGDEVFTATQPLDDLYMQFCHKGQTVKLPLEAMTFHRDNVFVFITFPL